MILINFGHPFTPQNLEELRRLLGEDLERQIDAPVQLDPMQPFAPQVVEIVDGAGLTSLEWQTQPIVVNPPTLNVIAAAVLAELHGRMGHFPPVTRLRSAPGSVAVRYEVAEVMDLQAQRDAARARRSGRVSE